MSQVTAWFVLHEASDNPSKDPVDRPPLTPGAAWSTSSLSAVRLALALVLRAPGEAQMRISMKVDGVTYEDEVEPRTLLTHHLRDRLGRVGTPIGCDTSNCGSCTVLIDGESVKSCSVLTVQADGAEITTIQGLADAAGGPESWHPVQKAFQEHHGLQCGYCTPGMILATVDLLKRNASPTEDDVRHGLEGNLCRCTGYQNIVKAVLSAASDLRGEGPIAGSFRDADTGAGTPAAAPSDAPTGVNA